MHHRGITIPVSALVFLCAFLTACHPEDRAGLAIPPLDTRETSSRDISFRPGGTPTAASQAGTPQTLIVNPLTRVGTDSAGNPALLVHLQLQDAFGQSTKALGVVRIELDPPEGATNPAKPPRLWQVDMRDPAANALMYDDLVTRTYVLPLGGIPDWLIDWSRQEKGRGGEVRVWMALEGGGVLQSSRWLGR